ncbi:hypothetical protein ACOSQ4_029769 [Xanthoceras sorbifolium]
MSRYVPGLKACNAEVCRYPERFTKWSSFSCNIFGLHRNWMETTNPLWRALEQTSLMMITLKKERRKCPSLTGGISDFVPGFYWESLLLFMCKTM